MFRDSGTAFIEQYGNSILRQPKAFVLILDFYTFFFIFYLENQEFSRAVVYLQFLIHGMFYGH